MEQHSEIGRADGKGCPPREIRRIEVEHFDVIRDEISILKPNLVLFLCGPDYDFICKRVFKDNISYESVGDFSQRHLAKVRLEGVEHAYRTYHPNYLWRNDIGRYFDSILNDLQFETELAERRLD